MRISKAGVSMRNLAAIWTEILGVDDLGPDDTFAELGGGSLDMVRLLSVVQQRFSVRLPISDVVAEPTLAGMARLLDREGASTFGSAGSIMVRVRTGADQEPVVFCFAGSGGSVWSFLPLASELHPGPALYAIQQRGLEHRALPHWRLTRLVRNAVREIKAVQPQGPYRLLGHSMGGVAAIETARLLEREGESVHFVLLLDATLPARTARVADAAAAPSDGRSIGVRQRMVLYARLASAGLIRRPLGVQQELFYELGLRVQNRHRLRPWAGRAIAVVTSDTAGDAAAWRRILPGELDLHQVVGDHMSVVREGAATAAIAEVLITELSRTPRS